MTRRREIICLIFILLFCFVARMAYITIFRERLDSLVISDMRTYNLLAKNLIKEGIYGFEDGQWPWPFRSYRPPLYPFFLSLIYRVAGFNYPVARLAQALLASFSCLALFLLAKELCGPPAALLGALLFALDISLIHLSGLFLSENLYIPLSFILLLLLIKGFRNQKLVLFVGAGFVGGLAALCRPIVLPFLVLVGLVPVLRQVGRHFRVRDTLPRIQSKTQAPFGFAQGLRKVCGYLKTEVCTLKGAATGFKEPLKKNGVGRGLMRWGVMLLVAGLTVLPWTLRNYRVHHCFILISTNTGQMLWMGLHHGAPGGYHFPEENNPLLSVRDEVERDRLGRREAVKFIFKYPGEFFQLAGKKFRQFWGSYLFTKSGKQWLIFMILGSGGLIFSFRDWRKWSVIYIYLLSFAAVHILVHSAQRYRWPLHPLIEIWVALFCIRLWESIKCAMRGKK